MTLNEIGQSFFQKFDKAVAETMQKAGQTMFHGTVSADKSPACIVIPPGYFVCCHARDAHCHGARFPFVARSVSAQSRLEAIVAQRPSKIVTSVTNILKAELGGKAAAAAA